MDVFITIIICEIVFISNGVQFIKSYFEIDERLYSR